MNSDSSPELEGELLDEFYIECDEHLKNIREGLIQLEESIGKVQPDLQLIEALFRNFHSFKGISAIAGLRVAEGLAHVAEAFLRELTRGQVSLTAQGLELLMAAAQKLEEIVMAFRSGHPLPDAAALQVSLRGMSEQVEPNHKSSVDSPGAAEVVGGAPAIDQEEKTVGRVLWRCSFVPNRELDQRGMNLNAVRARLSKAGEILRTTPQVQPGGKVLFEFLLATKETPSDVTSWEADGISVELVEQNPQEATSPLESSAVVSERLHTPFLAPSHIVRVDLHKLDELVRLAGEMVIQRSRFEELVSQATRKSGTIDPALLHELNVAMGRSLKELRRSLMRIRLVPVAEIFARMPFVVRDLARDTKKLVQLSLEGQQTLLDKYLVERLKDPLLHLVRNAFSHAVEFPEERLAAGKPAEALIALAARTVGDSVHLEVRDDGRGIDAVAVGRRARALGLSVPSSLNDSALLNVLCSPGFTTREDADRAAGRGVGMTVVANTVRELGGSMTLATTLGTGTTLTLRLPLTLAITEAFIVSSAAQTCAIPQSFVSEVLQIEEKEIQPVNGVEIVPYREGVLPVVRLSGMFNLPTEPSERRCLVVVSTERGSTGLVVDRIHGHREVVVQTIRDPLVQVPGIVGATELGDGRPVLILDGAVLTSGPVKPHRPEPNGCSREPEKSQSA